MQQQYDYKEDVTMSDWDKDGKTDWHDAYVFNEIIDKKPTGSHSSGSSSSSGSGWLWFILLLFLILIGK